MADKIMLLLSLRKLQEGEPLLNNVLFSYPRLSNLELTRIYEALALNSYIFSQRLAYPMRTISLNAHQFQCRQIVGSEQLFVFSTSPATPNLQILSDLLFDLLVLEFGCLPCAVRNSSLCSQLRQRVQDVFDAFDRREEAVVKMATRSPSAKINSKVVDTAQAFLRSCSERPEVLSGALNHRHRHLTELDFHRRLLAVLEFRRFLPAPRCQPFDTFHAQVRTLSMRDGVKLLPCFLSEDLAVDPLEDVVSGDPCAFRKTIRARFVLSEVHSDIRLQLLLRPRVRQELLDWVYEMSFLSLRDLQRTIFKSWDEEGAVGRHLHGSSEGKPNGADLLVSKLNKSLDLEQVELSDPPNPTDERENSHFSAMMRRCSRCLMPWKRKVDLEEEEEEQRMRNGTDNSDSSMLLPSSASFGHRTMSEVAEQSSTDEESQKFLRALFSMSQSRARRIQADWSETEEEK